MAINAVLYGGLGARWAMTERGRASLWRTADRLRIGPSGIACAPGSIEIVIDEWAVPVPKRLRGRIVIDTGAIFHDRHRLDGAGRHLWRPIAPFARVRVDFSEPDLRWQGTAYVDANRGEEPLENGFRFWTWSRAALADRATVFYDVERRDGGHHGIALSMKATGEVEEPARVPARVTLPRALWGVRRQVRSDGEPKDFRGLEDTPFYTRGSVRTVIDGRHHPTVCESVDLNRFSSRWVRMLLPFRMPRRP